MKVHVQRTIAEYLERVYMEANLLPSLNSSLEPYGIKYTPWEHNMGQWDKVSESSVESTPVECSPVVSLTESFGVSSIDDEREDQDK